MVFERELEKQIADLEEKISVLLSCKNCPENKGGWICQKEYEDKCLAQKIEFIKELQEENADLKEEVNKIAFARGSLEKENAELKGEADSVLDNWCKGNDPCPHLKKRDEQLTKAKEIINDLVHLGEFNENTDEEYLNYQVHEALKNAEQFLSEVEK